MAANCSNIVVLFFFFFLGGISTCVKVNFGFSILHPEAAAAKSSSLGEVGIQLKQKQTRNEIL